jgi:hypothetical protein
MTSTPVRAHSAFPAGWHQLGSTTCPSHELTSSKVARLALRCGIAWVSVQCLPMPQQPCTHADRVSQGPPPTTACKAPLWLHRPRGAMTSSKGICTVLCTGWALPQTSSQPSAASLALQLMPATVQTDRLRLLIGAVHNYDMHMTGTRLPTRLLYGTLRLTSFKCRIRLSTNSCQSYWPDPMISGGV